jgi:hypothetical protein
VLLKSRENAIRPEGWMGPLSLYGVGALALVLLVFYFVRKIPAYVAICASIVILFGVATFRRSDTAVSNWIVMVFALLLSTFGLLVVRVMLIRSVSLRLLAAIDAGTQETIGADIGGRLHDMRALHLVKSVPDGTSALTPFGWFVSSVIAVFYWLFRIET